MQKILVFCPGIFYSVKEAKRSSEEQAYACSFLWLPPDKKIKEEENNVIC